MTRSLKLTFLAAVLILMQACTSAHLKPVADPAKAMKPEAGKALVVFIRDSAFGGAIQSTVYDGEQYISTVSSGTRVAYQASPGEHMFMVIGESADFMKANLLAGKTYYATVDPRMGVWKARFSFIPIRKDTPFSDIQNMLDSTDLMEPNAEGFQWAKENAADIRAKRLEYLAKWNAKAKTAQAEQTLNPDDGR
jgi:hypothetical protein